jgi:hypothetical protein
LGVSWVLLLGDAAHPMSPVRAQQLQLQEATQGELLRKNALLRSLLIQLAPLLGKIIKKSWLKRQYEMRQGITQVHLTV